MISFIAVHFSDCVVVTDIWVAWNNPLAVHWLAWLWSSALCCRIPRLYVPSATETTALLDGALQQLGSDRWCSLHTSNRDPLQRRHWPDRLLLHCFCYIIDFSFCFFWCWIKPKFRLRGHKSRNFATQITTPTFMIFFRDKGLCRRLLVHCNGLNSIRATRTGLSQTCHGLCRKHLDMSRWFASTTFMICVRNFPNREVSVKVDVMEFGL